MENKSERDGKFEREGTNPVASGRNGPNVTLIGLAIVVAAGVAFFFQNGNSTSIHFLFFQKDAKTRWAIIVAVVLGILIDRIFTMWWRRRRRQNNA
jgi:fructose-specific phosphotransferase system IIC component